jgi:hypothetical protein
MYKFRTNEPLSPHDYKMIIENGIRHSDEQNMIIHPHPQKAGSKAPLRGVNQSLDKTAA